MLAELTTRSLRLVPQTPADVGRAIAAMTPEQKALLSAQWLALLAASAEPDPWVHGFRMLLRATGQGVGSAGFKGPPQDGIVEIAYGIDPEWQGRGYATEAAQALTRHAFACGSVRVVRAHTLRDGVASQRVLAKCGFHCVGEVVDPEDGPVLRFEKPLGRAGQPGGMDAAAP